MVKRKKKKKNLIVAALKQSASGWSKAIGYMWTGQWAKDISRAVHRSGSGNRAVQRARAAPKREEWQVEYRSSSPRILTEVMSKRVAQGLAIDMNKDEADKRDRLFGITKATNGAAINSAIKDAQGKANKQVTEIPAHGRKGSKGVSAHQRKLNPSERRASIAKALSKSESNGD